MALTKVTYTDGTTVIGAQNLNNIQDAIIALEAGGGGGGSGLTEDVKQALLQIAAKAAYSNTSGATYYQDLYDALYPTPSATLVSISAVYTQPGTVYDSATLDSLKANLVVTAHYDDSSTETVASSAYTLSGTLTVGTSTITVSYQGKTTTFTVTVTAAPTNYSVTNNLTAVTNSNNATTAAEGSSYTATLSPSPSDYTINSVTITMGGTDVTGTAYSNGTISIANVTGNIVITAVATQRQTTLSSISAVFSQGQVAIYETTPLNDLKQYLVVTAHWSDSSTSTVASSDYTLSGTLSTGTSTITVSYGGKTTTFNVIVSEPLTETITWSGTGADKASNIIDATEHDVYWTMPFVSGATQLAAGATASSTAGKLMDVFLYSDAEGENYICMYYTDDGTTSETGRSAVNCPWVEFDNPVLVIPKGYYGKLRVSRTSATEAFTSNSNLGSYLNQYATTITLA